MISLAIEASHKTLSVALFEKNNCLAYETLYNTLQHSIHLAPTVQNVLQHANKTMQQLNCIIISNGPGSYTGLRIGVSYAKTLAYTLNIPIIPVSSLNVLAHSFVGYVTPNTDDEQQTIDVSETNDKSFVLNERHQLKGNSFRFLPELLTNNYNKTELSFDCSATNNNGSDAIITAFYDARRGNVFIGTYQYGQSIVSDTHQNLETYLHDIKQKNVTPTYFVSPDMPLYEDSILREFPHATCIQLYPQAIVMQSFSQQKGILAHELVPYYLKLVEAEENWLAQVGQKANHNFGDWVERGAF